MGRLYDMIITVTEFPELYLGNRSLERLYAFIGGFLYQNEEANDHCLDGFTAFVANKYHMCTDHNWSSYIRFFSISDEEAFETFVRLFHEFHKMTK